MKRVSSKISSVVALPNFKLGITFDDGLSGEVCLAQRLFGPMFEPLKNAEYFAQVTVDEFGAVCWPNGADLAPDALYEQISTHAAS